MRKLLTGALILSAFIIFSYLSALAQTTARPASGNTCESQAYSKKDVESPAVIISRPSTSLSDEARANGVRGRISIKAIFCRSRKVTNIQVIEGLPHGMTEKVVDAISRIEFTPARIAGKSVSQVQNFVFTYSLY